MTDGASTFRPSTRAIYAAGVQAFYFGKSRSSNPEPAGFRYDIWECGWFDAQDQHEAAKHAAQEWYHAEH